MRNNVDRLTSHVPLVRAILGLPDDGLPCNWCQACLPAYVDAEIGGLCDHQLYLPMKRHLLLCPGCAVAYLELLELALAEEQGQLPWLTRYPEPDLGFLSGGCCDGR